MDSRFRHDSLFRHMTQLDKGGLIILTLVGSLIYLTHSRPDLSFVFSLVSWFMQQPHESHSHEDKRILIYLQRALHYGVCYSSNATASLSIYTNFDWAGGSYDQWSSAHYIFQLGLGSIFCSNKKVKNIYLSLCETKYRASKDATKEEFWLWHVLS